MSFRKTANNHLIWKSYCEENQTIINELNLPNWIFLKESNFREFVTTGQMDEINQDKFDFSTLKDKLFWKLFNFINSYFENGFNPVRKI